MRASMHNGRTGSARHNDRSFVAGLAADRLDERAGHIDLSRSKDNDYVTWDGSKDFAVSELRYYQAHYQAALDAQNERHRAAGHPNRCKTIEQIYQGKRTRPEETILQIGNMYESVSPAVLQKCMREYTQWLGRWSKAHGNHMHLLTAAMHVDEATPHIHLRWVLDAPDRDGNPTPNQTQALKQSGVELPHPDKPEGRYNNRKMTFDGMARERWYSICQDHGIELETEPIKGVRHKDTRDYALQQHRAAQEATKQAKEADMMLRKAKAQNEALRASKPQSSISFRESKLDRNEVIISKDDFGYLMQQTAITETALANLDKAQRAHDDELEAKDEEIEELRTALQTQSIDDKIKQAAREAKLQRYEAAERLYPAVMARLLDGRYQDDRERDR